MGQEGMRCDCCGRHFQAGYISCQNCGRLKGMAGFAKPPLGIKPEWLAEGQRIEEIAGGIARFAGEGKPIPPQWVAELERRIANYNEIRKAC